MVERFGADCRDLLNWDDDHDHGEGELESRAICKEWVMGNRRVQDAL